MPLPVREKSLGENLEVWERSERRIRFREILWQQDQVNPKDVIHTRKNMQQKRE